MTTERVTVAGHRILLKPIFAEDKIQDGALEGFVLDVGDQYKREKAATEVAKVVAIGPMAWYAYDKYIPYTNQENPDWKPWCEVGDTVYFAKYGGKFIKVNDEEFIIINDEDIQGVIHDE